MARKRTEEKPDLELNLAPIMNMVVILIPLLLLSIVFLEVGVINITAPKLSVGPSTEVPPPEDDKKPLNLTVTVQTKGFMIAASEAVLTPRPGCPTQGPTICLAKQNVDVAAKFQRAREAMAQGNLVGGEAELKEALAAYNWPELYNQLMRIKKEYPDETIIKISADPDTPYSAIVRLMDVSRFQLAKESYGQASEFWSAQYKGTGTSPEELFPDPILSIAQ